MGLRRGDRRAPQLRLVVDNAGARRPLMPMLEVERRLACVERGLRRPGLAASERETLTEMRDLLCRALAARPFDPETARRCEHRLRWIEAAGRPAAPPPRLVDRALRALGAILPHPVASA